MSLNVIRVLNLAESKNKSYNDSLISFFNPRFFSILGTRFRNYSLPFKQRQPLHLAGHLIILQVFSSSCRSPDHLAGHPVFTQVNLIVFSKDISLPYGKPHYLIRRLRCLREEPHCLIKGHFIVLWKVSSSYCRVS